MRRMLLAAAWAVVSGIAMTAYAIQSPLPFSVTNSVVNEFEDILPGTSAQAPLFGNPYVEGAVVQVLDVSHGAYPPDANGIPHPSNTVLLTTRIGAGIDPSLPISGRCSGEISSFNRTSSSTNWFVMVRVFNKSALGESSFYGDSLPYNVPTYGQSYDVFLADVKATTNELNTADNDNDGLSDSWEKSYGTDTANPDSDGDGMLDGSEIRAGTDANDPDSLLIMVQLKPDSGNNLRIFWDSVPDVTYQIQYADSLTNGVTFTDLNGPVTATGTVSSTVVTNGLVNPHSIYRVRLVEPE